MENDKEKYNYNIYHTEKPGYGFHDSTFPNIRTLRKDVAKSNKSTPTSIPSPFAYIDLALQAFMEITDGQDTDILGKSPAHQVASDVLDVAELFFFAHKYKELQIKVWDPKNMQGWINEPLKNSFMAFWNAVEDRNTYGFDQTPIYILVYKYHTVVGATSPATLWFAAPDVHKKDFDFNEGRQRKYFSGKPVPLIDREHSFIEYLFALQASEPITFGNNFPAFNSYLTKTLRRMSPDSELHSKIMAFGPQTLDEYPTNEPVVVVRGFQLRKEKVNEDEIRESDFCIKSSYYQQETPGLPLVLPDQNGAQYMSYRYNNETHLWNAQYEIKDKEQENKVKNEAFPQKSVMPYTGDSYYWLTRDNFLEDKLILAGKDISNDHFKTFGLPDVLLPLTDVFFTYFRPKDIEIMLPGEVFNKEAKVGIYIEKSIGEVITVRLSIPVRKGRVNFTKHYSASDIISPESQSFDLAIMPFITSKQRVPFFYNIGVIEYNNMDGNSHTNISILSENKKEELSEKVLRQWGNGDDLTGYYTYTGVIDALQICYNGKEGVLIPQFKEYSGKGGGISFAVDFGTTNTHIHYQHGTTNGQPFNYLETDKLIGSMLKEQPGRLFEHELIPFVVDAGDGTTNSSRKRKVQFPVRSAMLVNKKPGESEKWTLFQHLNVHLLYPRDKNTYLDSRTNLKWDKDSNYTNLFIEQLMRMVYLKALSLDCDLNQVNVHWFYPIAGGQLLLQQAWDKANIEVFGPANNPNESVIQGKAKLHAYPESVAPYFARVGLYGNAALTAYIDIGGGTSDFGIFRRDDKTYVTISSVRFAGENIYNDGFGNNPAGNGFVAFYEKYLSHLVDAPEENYNQRIISNLHQLNERASVEICNTLFLMESSHFSFSKKLREEDRFFASYLTFFGSLVYYLAQIMKRRGEDIPSRLYFSGNAAKAVTIMDKDKYYQPTTHFFRYIFAKVYGLDIENVNLSFLLDPEPKTVTCQGGLVINKPAVEKPVSTIWIGMDHSEGNPQFISSNAPETKCNWSDLTDQDQEQVVESVKKFRDILLEYIKSCTYMGQDVFQVGEDKLDEVYALIDGLFTDSNIRIPLKNNRINTDKPVTATLFFTPLIDLLPKLSARVMGVQN